ncbi:hypothetical protein HEP_00362100, partial [Hepatocystis sp. ex Piliocolobus tephrosceles]
MDITDVIYEYRVNLFNEVDENDIANNLENIKEKYKNKLLSIVERLENENIYNRYNKINERKKKKKKYLNNSYYKKKYNNGIDKFSSPEISQSCLKTEHKQEILLNGEYNTNLKDFNNNGADKQNNISFKRKRSDSYKKEMDESYESKKNKTCELNKTSKLNEDLEDQEGGTLSIGNESNTKQEPMVEEKQFLNKTNEKMNEKMNEKTNEKMNEKTNEKMNEKTN